MRAVTFVAVIQVETATVNSNQVIRSYVFRRSTEGCHELNWLGIEIRTACSNNIINKLWYGFQKLIIPFSRSDFHTKLP